MLRKIKLFSNLIEAQKQHLEMWNLAVPGYGLDQEVLSYEKYGQLLNTDEVIFQASKSTLRRTRYDYIYKKYKPKFEIDQNDGLRLVRVQQGTNVWTRLFYRVLSPLYLPYFLSQRLAMLKRTPKQTGDEPQQKITVADALGELEKRILHRASNIARKREHRMTIIADLPKILRTDLKNFCDQMGIGFLQIVLPKEDSDFRFGKHDHHWNPRAHKLITEQLLPQSETRNGTTLE